ncbi:probable serine/threonine protein kinase IREH1 isoform X2 [Elaeis guineensis]|uniref:non-specific serine/threonine protein kinase n=1 Tax=Elaeis guineensis var. tenera TaxID=51953 RepID=A0A8N4IEK7_ELAGV|nr:probable serine/threonine protein kinase IREH1 isoform X2 [Elaeis guineensis]
MVFKGRFFSSKKSNSSSPDGSNSPKTPALESPSRSEEKKVKTDLAVGRYTLIKDAVKNHQQKKDKKGKKRETRGRETAPAAASSKVSPPAAALSAPAKLRKGAAASSLSPILATSLGLNRIETRSGPLLQEGLRGDHRISGLGGSNLISRGHVEGGCSTPSSAGKDGGGRVKKDGRALDKVPESCAGSWADHGGSRAKEWLAASLDAQLGSQIRNGELSNVRIGKTNSSLNHPEDLKCSAAFTPEVKATSAPRKMFPADIKSFSHELNSKGVQPFPFRKPRSMYNLKGVLKVIQAKFEKSKEEVNSDLAIFAGDLVGVMEKSAESHPEWKVTLEDLLILARSCCVMMPGEFWLHCEGIVQDLDDRRQELPMGVLKNLHTHLLFILTRCTRLLQFHKETGLAEDEIAMDLQDPKIIHSADKKVALGSGWDGKNTKNSIKAAASRKSCSQQQHNLKLKRSQEIKPDNFSSRFGADIEKDMDLPTSRERIASGKPLPSPAAKFWKEASLVGDEISNRKMYSPEILNTNQSSDVDLTTVNPPDLPSYGDSSVRLSVPSKHQHKISWGYWMDQPNISEEGSIMCRICEEYVPILNMEDHLMICAIADWCDKKGLSVDERLNRIAETLEKMIEAYSQKDPPNVVGSPDVKKVSNSSVTEEFDLLSPKLSDWPRRGSADMLDCFQEADNAIFLDDLQNLPSVKCKTRFGPKSDQGMAVPPAGSMGPRSPLMTPRASHREMLLAGKNAVFESEDLPQIAELADIARCIANTPMDEEQSLSYLVFCVEDLQEVMNRWKFEALTVQTFGTHIEKLHREKYLQLCDSLDTEKVDASIAVMDEEEDVVCSLQTSPVHPTIKDRTSFDDFEIIKPISRGAFGRVFLAKKRTTGDLFAIKVLKKADMIRKNAVESILAERDILITVQNPFVVRFFYSFTSRENLYLVMEYLNGGDLYSLVRNLGCLDEEVARIYIAEVVLALEYLHSLHVVHRDLKPDNLLIAHDGHIKLTDFGLSKVGLINSTDDLSAPAVSGTSLYGEDEQQVSLSEHLNQQERWKKHSAVGTPDYLAPEILLGTGHGASADWWSVGVILFELIVGIPPFNAEHPQIIFDNILNRKIPWPRVPEEMSFEAQDIIDKLLTEDPHERFGHKGASEVKQHIFFKNINWDTLARQKAAFVPSSDNALDTSYFSSRYSWNPSDENIYEASEFEDSSDNRSLDGSSSCVSNHHDEQGGDCGGLAEFESGSSIYLFSNFSFKGCLRCVCMEETMGHQPGCSHRPPPAIGAINRCSWSEAVPESGSTAAVAYMGRNTRRAGNDVLSATSGILLKHSQGKAGAGYIV